MGMNDSLICSVPLPGSPPAACGSGYKFGTKSLECSMNTYEITADGRLVLTHNWFATWTDGDSGDRSEEVPDFHGDLYFNSSSEELGDGQRGYVTYRARFTEGRLARITEFKRETEAEIAAVCEQIRADMAKRATDG